MNNNNKWDELSLTEKSEIMRQAVANGITDLNEIRQTYNEYADGGSMDNPPNQLPEVEVTAQYPYEQRVIDTMNNSSPEFLERLRNNDRRSIHNPDGTSSTHVLGSADNIVFPEIMDVNGKLIDNRSMPWQSAMRYAIKNNDYIEFPTEGDARYFGEHYKKYFPKFFDNTFAGGGKVAHDARYNHVTQIYQSYINQGVNPQTALELTNQKIAEKGWTGWVSGDNKRYNNVDSFTGHTIDQFNRLYPDSLKSNNFNQFFQGIEGGRTKYNPTPNIYRQHLLQTRPGVKKRINEYRRLQGQSPLSLVSPTSTPLPWEESMLYNPQLPLEVPTEQPVIAADGGYLYARGGKLSQQNQRAGYAVDYFMNKGLSREAAAGLVGNLMRESRMNSNAINPASGAYGLGQWLGSRKTKLFKKYGRNPSFYQQLDYIWDELNTSHRKGLQMLKSSKTVDEAARNAFGYYEFSAGPQAAIAAMNKNGKNTKWKNPNGTVAMNDGITNAWVAYGKANPNAKLQGLNVNAPVLRYNRTIPNYDFTSAVDSLNVQDSIANFSGETPKFQYNSFPPNPTDYGTPISWSTPEKKVETPTITPKEDNNGLGLLALINQIYDSPKQEPLATYTPQRSNSMFVVSAPTSNNTFLDSSWFKEGGYLYGDGGKLANTDPSSSEYQDLLLFKNPLVKLFDPTGISSWKDVKESYEKEGLSANTLWQVAGAIPLFGKLKSLGRAVNIGQFIGDVAEDYKKIYDISRRSGNTLLVSPNGEFKLRNYAPYDAERIGGWKPASAEQVKQYNQRLVNDTEFGYGEYDPVDPPLGLITDYAKKYGKAKAREHFALDSK